MKQIILMIFVSNMKQIILMILKKKHQWYVTICVQWKSL